MPRKILVTKEWHQKAMAALGSVDKCIAYVTSLQSFMATNLTSEQQEKLDKELEAAGLIEVEKKNEQN